jgi:hypothetical protein
MVVSVTIIRILLVMTAINLKIGGLYRNEYLAVSSLLDFYHSSFPISTEESEHTCLLGVVRMTRPDLNFGSLLYSHDTYLALYFELS